MSNFLNYSLLKDSISSLEDSEPNETEIKEIIKNSIIDKSYDKYIYEIIINKVYNYVIDDELDDIESIDNGNLKAFINTELINIKKLEENNKIQNYFKSIYDSFVSNDKQVNYIELDSIYYHFIKFNEEDMDSLFFNFENKYNDTQKYIIFTLIRLLSESLYDHDNNKNIRGLLSVANSDQNKLMKYLSKFKLNGIKGSIIKSYPQYFFTCCIDYIKSEYTNYKDDNMYCILQDKFFESQRDSLMCLEKREDYKLITEDIKTNSIYAILPNNQIYTSIDERLHHSSFFCGQPVIMAGIINLNGDSIIIDNDSGHYKPTKELFKKYFSSLINDNLIEDGNKISITIKLTDFYKFFNINSGKLGGKKTPTKRRRDTKRRRPTKKKKSTKRRKPTKKRRAGKSSRAR